VHGRQHRPSLRLPLAALLLAGLALAPPAAAARPRIDLGHFAGYVWDGGRVGSVSATFTVPRILPGSPPGSFGATWIGAQAPGVDGPFIQIGVNEVHLLAPVTLLGRRIERNVYYAFWSDTRLHFHARLLAVVHPGDQIAVSLHHVHDGWKLALVDATRRAATRFFTRDEAHGAFNWAEWLQEDPTVRGKPLPYPRLAGVHFAELRGDYMSPTGLRLLSQWMTVSRGDLGPSPLSGDAFTERHRRLGRASASFWRLALPEDAAAAAFDADMLHWSATTPRAAITAESAAFAAALRANIRGFERTRWPPALLPFVRAIVERLRALVPVVESAPRSAPIDLGAWLRGYRRRAGAVSAAGRQITARTHGPALAA
jgi:hypothetical protein